MIIESLYAVLGIKVEGQEKLRQVERQLDRARTGFQRFGDTVRARLGIASAAMDRSSKRSTIFAGVAARTARATTALATIFRTLARVAPMAGLAMAGIATVAAPALAFVGKLSGAAAQAREQLQLLARSQGTRPNFAEQMAPFLSLAGVPDAEKVASKGLETVSEKLREARDDPEAAAEFKKAGINIRKPDGSLEDASVVFFDIVRKLGELGEKEAKARKPREREKLQKLAEDTGKLGGLDGTALQRLKETPEAELVRLKILAGSRRPAQSDADESETAALAKRWRNILDELSAVFDGIVGRFGDVGTKISTLVIGPIESISNTLFNIAKTLRLIPQTAEEAAKAQAESEAARQRSGSKLRDDMKSLDNLIQGPRGQQPRPQVETPPVPQRQSIIEQFQEYMNQMPTIVAASLSRSAEFGSRTYQDIGHDQRTQTVNISMVANGLQDAVNQIGRSAAASLNKAMTTASRPEGVGA